MIDNLVLRWVVTGLFALTAVECVLPIITQRRPWNTVISHGLHFLMAVGMAVMAWPWSARLPTTGPTLFFLLAAAWFVSMAVVAARTNAVRVLCGYHGLMMLASAWMYAVMNGHLLHVQTSTQPAMSMPGTDMGAMSMPASSAPPIWFSTLAWFGTVGFAAAAVFWTRRYFMQRREAVGSRSLGNLGQAMMAGGMAILFLAMLFEI